MNSKYFNNNISPACEYCEYGRDSNDMVLCKLKGVVSPYFRCKKFKYSPVRREPKPMPTPPKRDPSEFSL